jgi:hypothetical protein
MQEAGLRRAAVHTWAAAAQRLLGVLEEVRTRR